MFLEFKFFFICVVMEFIFFIRVWVVFVIVIEDLFII